MIWSYLLIFNVPWMFSTAQTLDQTNTTLTSRQDRSLKHHHHPHHLSDTDFRPSAMFEGDGTQGLVDDFGNEPWSPRPRITFEDDDYYEEETAK